MSRYLAPIHSWLFNKIKLFEELEGVLVESLKETYGKGEIEDIIKTSYEKYGVPLEEKPLEELIDTSNIHGWLQNRITIAETRECYILNEIFKKYGEEAENIASEIYSRNGGNWGVYAKENYDISSAPQIYDALNDFVLDGMPCDNVNNVIEEREEYVGWKSTKCLHRGYWETVGANINVFYRLRNRWIQGFVENANNKFTYAEKTQEFNGVQGFLREIFER